MPSGAQETATFKISSKLQQLCTEYVSKHFKVSQADISMDCDAFSVVLETDNLTPERQKCIKSFLQLFGTRFTTGCSSPKTPTGSRKKDDIFGCSGNKCQHLSTILQGEEMLVLDTPVKVALHKSCQQNLLSSLRQEGYHLSPASSEGLCFDPTAAANFPPYDVMMTAIINSCQVDQRLTEGNPIFIIHVADIGFRLPIGNDTEDTEGHLESFFTRLRTMRTHGISVELAQMDIAFVSPIHSGQLFHMSSTKKKGWKNNFSVVDQCEMKIFPIHKLPSFNENERSQNKQNGTISLKRRNWENYSTITLGNPDDDDQWPDQEVSKAVDLFQSQDVDGKDELIIHKSDIHNTKHYSTFVHGLSQIRSKLPLSPQAMYGIGKRSIKSLQALLKVIDHKRKEVFKDVDNHGIGLRVEVSIRPHFNSPLRSQGHYNDVLLHVCLAIHDYYQAYNIKLDCIPARAVQTNTMIRISQAMSHLKFRHSCQFCEIYKNPKVTAWLRAHLSMLLITIGICPVFAAKYINQWLNDSERYDPFEYSGKVSTITTEKTDIRLKDMIRSLDKFFIIMQNTCVPQPPFKSSDIQKLKTFIKGLGENKTKQSLIGTRDFYTSLSLQGKLNMTTSLGQIISHVSQYLTGDQLTTADTSSTTRNGITEEPDEDEHGLLLHNDLNWWEQLEDVTRSDLDKLVNNKDTGETSNPILRVIHHLASIETFFSPSESLFAPTLSQHILQCHSRFGLEQQLPGHLSNALQTCSSGGQSISREELRHLCEHLNINMASHNFTKEIFLAALGQHYSFPCPGAIFCKTSHTCCGIIVSKSSHKAVSSNYHAEEINQTRPGVIISYYQVCESINDAINHDFTVRIAPNRVYRNLDMTIIDIPPYNEVAAGANQNVPLIPKTSKKRNIYKVLAKMCNTSEIRLRKILHTKLRQLPSLQNSFLTSTGTTDPEFKGADSINQLESSKEFKLIFTGQVCHLIREMSFPHVILPITSLVYDRNIILYDYQNSRTTLYINHQSRVKEYHFEGVKILSKKIAQS